MRFGLVGLGWAARGYHLPALSTVPNAEIVGGVDADEAQRSAWTERTGAPAFASLEELLAATRPDVVVVGTPPDSHAALCISALQGEAHVICEKPFVSTVEEADMVLAAAADAGRYVAVNHQYREKPIFSAVKERIGAPDVGRLVFCQLWQLMDLPPWDEKIPWRAAMPNRTLFEGGVHLVDLLLHLYGALPRGGVRQALERPRPLARRGRGPPRDARVSRNRGSPRSRSTGSAPRQRGTSSSGPTASTPRSAPRTAVACISRPA